MKNKVIILIIAVIAVHMSGVYSQSIVGSNINEHGKYVQIRNIYSKFKSIYIDKGEIKYHKTGFNDQRSNWIIEKVNGTNYIKIKNRKEGTYLNVENGSLQCSEIQPGWHSAMWELEPITGENSVRIKNRWKGTYLDGLKDSVRCDHQENLGISKYVDGTKWQLYINPLRPPGTGAVALHKENGKTWTPNEIVLESFNKRFSLIFQEDGNLVLYKDEHKMVWSANCQNKGATKLVYQSDGNFVVYKDKEVLWAANCHDKSGDIIVLQDDGNLVIYDSCFSIVWNTNTIDPKIRLKQSPVSVKYDKNKGCGQLTKYYAPLKKHCGWRKTWDNVYIVGCLHNSLSETAILFYDKTAGYIEIYSIDNLGNMNLVSSYDNISKDVIKLSYAERTKHIVLKYNNNYYELYNLDDEGNMVLTSKIQR